MRLDEVKTGMRVDHGELRDGEVLRVGRATVWAVFLTPQGNHQVNAPASEFRPHVRPRVRVGEFELSAGLEPGTIWIRGGPGEGGAFPEAKLEALLRHFWNAEF